MVGRDDANTTALRLENEGSANDVVALHVHDVGAHFVKDLADLRPDFPGDADAVGLVSGGQVRAQTMLNNAAFNLGAVAGAGDGAGGYHVHGVATLEHGVREAVPELCRAINIRWVGLCANQNRLCLVHDGAPHRV